MRMTRPKHVRPKGSHVVDEIKVSNGQLIWRDKVVSKDEWERRNGQ